MMRDNLANESFWIEREVWQNRRLQKFSAFYDNQDEAEERRSRAGTLIYDMLLEMSLIQYSIGKPIGEVASLARNAVCFQFPQIVREFGRKMPNGIPRSGYSETSRQIALLVLCRASPTEVDAYFDALDQFDLEAEGYGGYDRIWNAYREYFGLPRAQGSVDVHWPAVYSHLLDVIRPDEPDFARPRHLRQFLEGWYVEMASEMAAQTTRGDQLTETSTYVGYWCLEAAAAAVAFNIDDRDFRDHPYYPKDWADWSRRG